MWIEKKLRVVLKRKDDRRDIFLSCCFLQVPYNGDVSLVYTIEGTNGNGTGGEIKTVDGVENDHVSCFLVVKSNEKGAK
jgi:hypothetical protein